MNFPSKLIENAVNEFSRLPGIGKKTALRLVLHLLNKDLEQSQNLGNAIVQLKENIKYCNKCCNVSDDSICSICKSELRNKKIVCVVESLRDVIAIENTSQFNGVYHVLGGVISPIEGVGPEHLKIDELFERIANEQIEELIMALNPTMDGDTTIFYINRKLKEKNVKITTLARGVAFGGNLEYVDEHTLARSIVTRIPYEKYLVR